VERINADPVRGGVARALQPKRDDLNVKQKADDRLQQLAGNGTVWVGMAYGAGYSWIAISRATLADGRARKYRWPSALAQRHNTAAHRNNRASDGIIGVSLHNGAVLGAVHDGLAT
jgi:hypothetical protein